MSKEYIIKWDCGYGDNYEVVTADNREEAMDMAYEVWRDDVESNADYDVIGEATDELKEDYGVY